MGPMLLGFRSGHFPCFEGQGGRDIDFGHSLSLGSSWLEGTEAGQHTGLSSPVPFDPPPVLPSPVGEARDLPSGIWGAVALSKRCRGAGKCFLPASSLSGH